MGKKVTDFSPYMQSGETLICKQRCEKGNKAFAELAACLLLLLMSIAGDGFMIGAMSEIRKYTKNSESFLIVLIVSIIIHIIPFAAWLVSILKKLSPLDEKWYAVTDKRLAVVTGVKPVNVCFLNLTDVTSIALGNNRVVVFYGEEKLVLNGLSDAEGLYNDLEKILFPEAKFAAGETDPVKTTNVTLTDSAENTHDGLTERSTNEILRSKDEAYKETAGVGKKESGPEDSENHNDE